MKVTRDISTHLFKYVKRVDIRFNPFDDRTRSARELMRQVQAERFIKANPKLKINKNVVGTIDTPSVEFEFVDGTVKTFDSKEFLAKEMLSEVYTTADNLDIEYELAGKSIDDK
mmetsp:Transcript_23181/g.33907  ORF Transcript_23181/g.33907 Transcript_23181/m.33907 type:complete len:114 (+) Transcript_23181:224-565(+)|eukprot:CAMPEP_0197242940 /NCGR_PEP_ID=MMETSP1429-20130617/8545_1 /TAXON_ID=49237 /ORGANISM="Chaetoceros  sp., Strain UNC1202" /LENGTH=113 /DNA_ID=CAMNT_0042703071 /DNA_START=165 /DNA_END=506 /DNA_ORIENTATION=+